jgi:hypothetical protein
VITTRPEARRSDRRLAKECSDLLVGLDIPQPFDVDELVKRLDARRGRAIHVIEESEMGCHEDHASGWWLKMPDVDVLFIKRGLPPLLRNAAVLHEVGHILWDHPSNGEAQEAFAAMMPILSASGALDRFPVLARRGYDTPHEVEAETFARVLLARVDRTAPSSPAACAAATAEAATTLDRLARALGSAE